MNDNPTKLNFFLIGSILATYLILTIFLTYPLILNLDDAVLGHDALYASWLLAWGAHQVVNDPVHLFDTNCFYPERNTLAYGEHLLGFLPFTLTLFLLTENSLLVHNLLLVITMALTAWATFLLAFKSTKSLCAGWIAGIIFGFCPYKFSHVFHLELAASPLFPLAFLGLFLMLENPSRKPWLLLTIAYVWQGLMSWYYGLFLFMGLAVVFTAYLILERFRLNKKCWSYLSFFIITISVVFGLIGMPYFKAKKVLPFISNDQYLQFRSADLKSFLIAPEMNWIYGNLFERPANKFIIASLFPGIICLLLVIVSFSLKTCRENRLKTLVPWICVLCTGFVFSLGPVLSLNGNNTSIKLPYYWLVKIPGLSGFRVPERASVLTMLALALLAAHGTASLIEKLVPAWKKIVTIIISLLIILEYLPVPLPYDIIPVSDDIPEVYNFLKTFPENTVILEYPFTGPELHDRIFINDNVLYNYYSTYHWKKLVNGTGVRTKLYNEIISNKQDFPSQDVLYLLKKHGVNYIIIHNDSLSSGKKQIIEERLKSLENISVSYIGNVTMVKIL